MGCTFFQAGEVTGIICGGPTSNPRGYLVKTLTGIVGEVKVVEKHINGKVPVRSEKGNLLCRPETLEVIDVLEDHECDSKGRYYLSNDRGQMFYEGEYPEWDTDREAREKFEILNNINSGGVTCSICGGVPPMPNLYRM